MDDLIERLNGLELRLVAPHEECEPIGPDWPTARAIARFRRGVYSQSHIDEPLDDSIDRRAWHLVAMRGGLWLGCVRLHVFRPEQVRGLYSVAIANSRCDFGPAGRSRCEAAVTRYAETSWLPRGGPLVQVCGLTVIPSARRSGVGAVLCLAGNAMLRRFGAVAGLAFAAEEWGSASLCARVGCTPLTLPDGALGPLVDRFHQGSVLVMGIEPTAVAPEVDSLIVALGQRLAHPHLAMEVEHA